jgi:hypothetical protein
MGNYRIVIDAVGGHGCQRDVKDGEEVQDQCGSTHCPDCAARAFVTRLAHQGNDVRSATLTHWPGTLAEVKDDLVSRKRTGNFREAG